MEAKAQVIKGQTEPGCMKFPEELNQLWPTGIIRYHSTFGLFPLYGGYCCTKENKLEQQKPHGHSFLGNVVGLRKVRLRKVR